MSIEQKKSVLTDEFIKIKHHGKIFTPDYLVKQILDRGHYVKGNIRKKHIIENSCGDGQFLIQIVDRYCKDFFENSDDTEMLKKELETYIHAIEIEKDELDICKERCSQVAQIYGINEQIKWDFLNADTLKTDVFNGKMDFVVGNPPYVRVHNLNENFDSVKSFLFGNGGMTDLYIVFYEIGLKMLNNSGILCYITPSSFFTSLAGTNMRKYLVEKNLLESVCDLKHFQAFNSTTYTTIVCLNKNNQSELVDYYEYDPQNCEPFFVEKLSIQDYYLNNCFYFSTQKSLSLLKKIMINNKHANVSVKNGYATLADKVFVNKFTFESKHIIPVIKASRGIKGKIIFPYDINGKLLPEDQLKKDEPLYQYLISNKSLLKKRSNEKKDDNYWYAYGRSQAINDTFKDKLTINALIRTSSDLKLMEAKSGTGVYSGLYVTSETMDLKQIKTALLDKEFETYVCLLGKYKSGGYYTFSSKDVKCYLDYKLSQEGY